MQRSWAQLILSPLKGLVALAELSGTPKDNTDADTHDRHDYFFPGHRAFDASTTDFDWRGGGELVKVLGALLACCTIPSLGGARKYA